MFFTKFRTHTSYLAEFESVLFYFILFILFFKIVIFNLLVFISYVSLQFNLKLNISKTCIFYFMFIQKYSKVRPSFLSFFHIISHSLQAFPLFLFSQKHSQYCQCCSYHMYQFYIMSVLLVCMQDTLIHDTSLLVKFGTFRNMLGAMSCGFPALCPCHLRTFFGYCCFHSWMLALLSRFGGFLILKLFS